MAFNILKGGLSSLLKGLIIFVLVTALGFAAYNFYVLPMLTDAIQRVYIDPLEFRLQSFDLDTLISEEEPQDFVYREFPSNPFMPLDAMVEVVEEKPPEEIFQKKTIKYYLRGIVSGYQKNLAIIEGGGFSYILKEGDHFDDLQVIEIGQSRVLVRDEVWSVYKLLLGGGYGESI